MKKKCGTNAGVKVQLTMLNDMAAADIYEAMDNHVNWGLGVLDLREKILGNHIHNVTIEDAKKVAAAATVRGLTISTLSTGIFGGDIEKGEAEFVPPHLKTLDHILELAGILRPKFIRLLMAGTSKRANITYSPAYLDSNHPWVVKAYQRAVDTVAAAGFAAGIECEVGQCLFSRPEEVAGFFKRLDQPASAARFVWDIQNLWVMGTFPTIEAYEMMRPWIGLIHLKGGRSDLPGGQLKWKASLEDASWPVIDICRAAIRDGVSPVICLNPSHGEVPAAGFVEDYSKDIAFLKSNIKEMQ